MGIQDKLIKNAKKNLVTSSSAFLAPAVTDLDTTINRIKRNIKFLQTIKDQAETSKSEIVKDLIFLKNHQEELLNEKGITFEDFLKNEIGIAKSFFYEQIKAYELCLEYNRTDLYDSVDSKILVNIARMDDKKQREKYLIKSPELSRKDIPLVRRPNSEDAVYVLPKDEFPTNKKKGSYIKRDKKKENLVFDFLKNYSSALSPTDRANFMSSVEKIIKLKAAK
jgi:hypothetical protein